MSAVVATGRDALAADVVEQLTTWRDFVAEHGPKGAGDALHYKGDGDLVLCEGQPFRSVPWTTWRGSGYRRGKKRECFKNAFELAWRHDLDYVEGFASTGLLAVPHAWCALPGDDRVIDPTWRQEGREERPVETWQYLGVRFDKAWAFDRMGDTYGLLGANYDLWKRELPEEARA